MEKTGVFKLSTESTDLGRMMSAIPNLENKNEELKKRSKKRKKAIDYSHFIYYQHDIAQYSIIEISKTILR